LSSHTLILDEQKASAELCIYTMGQFNVVRFGDSIKSSDWGRDKTIQLFQFLLTTRHRNAMHKEQMINRLWPEANQETGDRDFKVALHGINKVIEPNKASRSEARYIIRQGLTYRLDLDKLWIDVLKKENGYRCLYWQQSII